MVSTCKALLKQSRNIFALLSLLAAFSCNALAADNATLIMYYSMTGKTRLVANELKALLPSADLVEIKSDVSIPVAVFWHLPFDQNAAVATLPVDPERYSRVILCTPVWMQRISSPAKTVIKTVPMQGKPLEVFVTCAGHFGEGGQQSLQELLASKGIKLAGLHIVRTAGQTEAGIRNQVRAEAQSLWNALPAPAPAEPGK